MGQRDSGSRDIDDDEGNEHCVGQLERERRAGNLRGTDAFGRNRVSRCQKWEGDSSMGRPRGKHH